MDLSDITIDTISNVVAMYAAIVSTIVLVILLLKYRKDRAIVKLEVQHGMKITPNPVYDHTQTYTVLTVRNHGHRAAAITSVVMKYKDGSGAILSDSLESRKVQAGESTKYIIIEEESDLERILCYEVADALDNTYTCTPNKNRD
ncbi:MAG: hypothetical protein ACE5GA_08805 [Candidatus Zixiibacteriota bacterium]